MTKLRLSAIPDHCPVKIAVEFPAAVLRDLQAYAAILANTLAKLLYPIQPNSSL